MKLFRNPLVHYAVLIWIYLLLAMALPANHAAMHNYSLTSLQYHLLLLLVILPFTGIWFAAFYGYSRLSSYASSIRSAAEGNDFHQLAVGSGWLAYSLPITALTSIILNGVANSQTSFHPAAIIIINYVSLLLPLIAFTILSKSARQLSSRANLQVAKGTGRGLMVLFALLGIVYCYFSFQHLNSLSLTSTDNIYFLPVWLAIISVVMPYLFAWFVGLLAAYEIMMFAQQSKGIIYAEALRYVSFGIATVIVSSISLRYILSIIPRAGALHLNYILLSVLIVELLLAGGYSCIALGARRLQRIEEV